MKKYKMNSGTEVEAEFRDGHYFVKWDKERFEKATLKRLPLTKNN